MTLSDWSYVLAAVNLTQQFLIAHHKASGWLVAIFAQVPWVIYDALTRQYGLMALPIVLLPVYWHGWQTYHKHHPKTSPEPALALEVDSSS